MFLFSFLGSVRFCVLTPQFLFLSDNFLGSSLNFKLRESNVFPDYCSRSLADKTSLKSLSVSVQVAKTKKL